MCHFKAAATHKPVEGRGNRLEVYPSGANPLNDILIAFLFFLWIFNGLASFLPTDRGLSLLASHIMAGYDIIFQKNDAPFVIFGGTKF